MHFKERPDDFEVKEVMDLEVLKKGSYVYYLLKKKGWGSFEAFREIGKRSGISTKLIGYAGLKDKQAVTEQYISVPSTHGKHLERIKIRDIELEFVGYGEERITLGSLKGNRFRIAVRDADEKKELVVDKMKNYFDTQRFGKKALKIGKAMVQQNFPEVCKLLKLKVDGYDYVGALRRLDKRTLRFLISSYQSFLWNRVVEEVPDDVERVPLIGYLTTFEDPPVKKLHEKLMKEEGITLQNFLMPGIPELSSEGSERAVYFTVQDFSYQWEKDELHGGKWKCILTFFLPKGCYATLVVKELFPGVKDKSAS